MIYLPYPDFDKTAKVLHLVQLVEEAESICVLMEYLHDTDKRPEQIDAVLIKAWEGFEPQLCELGVIVCEELESRGLIPKYLHDRISWHLECATSGNFDMRVPPWMGREIVHISHQAALVRADSIYRKDFPNVNIQIPVIWLP